MEALVMEESSLLPTELERALLRHKSMQVPVSDDDQSRAKSDVEAISASAHFAETQSSPAPMPVRRGSVHPPSKRASLRRSLSTTALRSETQSGAKESIELLMPVANQEKSRNARLRMSLMSTEREALLEQLLDQDSDQHRPQPVRIPSWRSTHTWCYAWWVALMPFHITFPFAVFMLILASCLAVCTIFVALEMAGFGPFVIANAPVWAWGAWAVVNWIVFFILWGIIYSIRALFIRKQYRVLKLSWGLRGAYAPSLALLHSVANFGILNLLKSNNLESLVDFWMTRIIFTFLSISIFWLLWSLAVRFFIARIERDQLWKRLANCLWRQKLHKDIMLAAHTVRKGAGFIERTLTGSHLRRHSILEDVGTVEEYDELQKHVLAEPDKCIDVPSILLADTIQEEREAQLCRLAVDTSWRVFRKLDPKQKGLLSLSKLVSLFGYEGAVEHLSLWDIDHDGAIGREEFVKALILLFHDIEGLRLAMQTRTPLGRILGTALGGILFFVCLIVVLQIYVILISIFLIIHTYILYWLT